MPHFHGVRINGRVRSRRLANKRPQHSLKQSNTHDTPSQVPNGTIYEDEKYVYQQRLGIVVLTAFAALILVHPALLLPSIAVLWP